MTDEQHPEGTPAPKTTITITDLADVREGDTVTVKFDGGTFVGPVRTTFFGGLEAGGQLVRESGGGQPKSTRFISATREIPTWPTAYYVWHDRQIWERSADKIGNVCYRRAGRILWEDNMADKWSPSDRERAIRFAADAVPVIAVPTEALEVLRTQVHIDDETGVPTAAHERLWQTAKTLIDATDAMREEGDW